MLISNPMKIYKNHAKSNLQKRSGKKDFYIFVTWCKCFLPLTFLSELFCSLNGFEISIKFCVFWYPY